MSLANDLESDPQIRACGRQNDRITQWPSVDATGVPSVKACSMNCRALEIVATWWVAMSDSAAAIPIDLIRQEASLGIERPQNIPNIGID